MSPKNNAKDEAVVPLDMCQTRLVDPERVKSVRERLPDVQTHDRLASIFRALGESTRLRIVTALLEAGELCVCDLAASVGMSETSTSRHLRILRSDRIVRNRRDGREVYYSLDDAHVRMLLDVALAHVGDDD